MNEHKVSKDRLRELIEDESAGLAYARDPSNWDRAHMNAHDQESAQMYEDKLSALRELLTLRQSASGEIEALEAGEVQQDGIDRVKNGLGELYCKVMDADESILNPRDNVIADALNLITELATLRLMAARMK